MKTPNYTSKKVFTMSLAGILLAVIFIGGCQNPTGNHTTSLKRNNLNALNPNNQNHQEVQADKLNVGSASDELKDIPLFPVGRSTLRNSEKSNPKVKRKKTFLSLENPKYFFDPNQKKLDFHVQLHITKVDPHKSQTQQDNKTSVVLSGVIDSLGKVVLKETNNDSHTRLIGVGQCLEPKKCQAIYIDIYYKIDGHFHRKQYFSYLEFEVENDESEKPQRLQKLPQVCDELNGCSGAFVGYRVKKGELRTLIDLLHPVLTPGERIDVSPKPHVNEKKNEPHTSDKNTIPLDFNVDSTKVQNKGQVLPTPSIQDDETWMNIAPDKEDDDDDGDGNHSLPEKKKTPVSSNSFTENDNKREKDDSNSSPLIQNNTSQEVQATDSILTEEDLREGSQSVGLPYAVCMSNCTQGECLKKEEIEKVKNHKPKKCKNGGKLVYGKIQETVDNNSSRKDEISLSLDKNEAFSVMTPSREQHYASGLMINFISKVSRSFDDKWKKNNKKNRNSQVVVNAVSKRGGGYLQGHSSHQNGLDADILYVGQDKWGSVLDRNGPYGLDRDFDLEGNYLFFLEAVKTGYVNRVFVDAKIKKALCQWAKENKKGKEGNSVLTRLRPYSGHDDHFHIRLKCSPFYPLCRDQLEPFDVGCP